jgi:hypothetical protein
MEMLRRLWPFSYVALVQKRCGWKKTQAGPQMMARKRPDQKTALREKLPGQVQLRGVQKT